MAAGAFAVATGVAALLPATDAEFPARLPTTFPALSLIAPLRTVRPTEFPRSQSWGQRREARGLAARFCFVPRWKQAERRMAAGAFAVAAVVAALLAVPRLRCAPPACPRTVRLRRWSLLSGQFAQRASKVVGVMLASELRDSVRLLAD